MLEIIYSISIILISISFGLIVIRLFKGPTLPDRIVALDMITTGAIGFIAVYAILTNSTKILDVGLIVGLISFLGTVAFAMFLERRQKNERSN